MDDSEILKYYAEYDFPSSSKLYYILKKKNLNIKLSDIERAIRQQPTYQLHKKQKGKVSSHMVAFYPNQIWMIDLLDMSKYFKQNKGFRWILLNIDIFTRQAYAVAMKNKDKNTVLDSFKKITNGNNFPDKLISDNGSEFTNKEFQNYLKENKIFHETNEVGYHNALGVIDRLSRTIKEKIFKNFTYNNNINWIDILKKVIDSYNNIPTNSLNGFSPNEAIDHFMEILEINIAKTKINDFNYKVGQLVRKKLKKPTFTKGYKQQWSNDIYEIKQISGVNAELDNGEIIKLNNLQIISKPTENSKANIDEKNAEQSAKFTRDQRKSNLDVDQEGEIKIPKRYNPESQKRIRKPNVRLKDL